MRTLLGFGIVVIATGGIYLLGRFSAFLMEAPPPPSPQACWYWVLGLLPVSVAVAAYFLSVRIGELLP